MGADGNCLPCDPFIPPPDDGLLDEINQICQYTLYSVNDFHLAISVLQEYYPLSCALEEIQLLRGAVFDQCHEIGAMVTIMEDFARFYSSVVANVNACEEDMKTEITRISSVVDIMLDSLQGIDSSVTVGIQYFRQVIEKANPVLPIMGIGLPRNNGPYMFLSKFHEFKVVEDLLDTLCRTVETCQELANYYEYFGEHIIGLYDIVKGPRPSAEETQATARLWKEHAQRSGQLSLDIAQVGAHMHTAKPCHFPFQTPFQSTSTIPPPPYRKSYMSVVWFRCACDLSTLHKPMAFAKKTGIVPQTAKSQPPIMAGNAVFALSCLKELPPPPTTKGSSKFVWLQRLCPCISSKYF